MKKNNKGFTLIELLAVIIILAIIALIAVPTVMGIIDSSRKKAAEDSAYGVLSAAELYYSEVMLAQNGTVSSDITFAVTDGILAPTTAVTGVTFDLKGEHPSAVTGLKVSSAGTVSFTEMKFNDGNISCKPNATDTNKIECE